MEAIPLAGLSIGGSSQAPIPATCEAIQTLPMVLVFDNEDLAAPFRKVAEFQNGKSVFVAAPVPQWLRALR